MFVAEIGELLRHLLWSGVTVRLIVLWDQIRDGHQLAGESDQCDMSWFSFRQPSEERTERTGMPRDVLTSLREQPAALRIASLRDAAMVALLCCLPRPGRTLQ